MESNPLEFWAIVNSSGLMDDIVTMISSRFVQCPSLFEGHVELRQQIAEMLTYLAVSLNLKETVLERIERRRLQQEKEQELLEQEIQELRRRTEESERMQLEVRRKSQILNNIFHVSSSGNPDSLPMIESVRRKRLRQERHVRLFSPGFADKGPLHADDEMNALPSWPTSFTLNNSSPSLTDNDRNTVARAAMAIGNSNEEEVIFLESPHRRLRERGERRAKESADKDSLNHSTTTASVIAVSINTDGGFADLKPVKISKIAPAKIDAGGYRYTCARVLFNGGFAYRCSKKSAKCKARVKTDAHGTVLEQLNEHTHPPMAQLPHVQADFNILAEAGCKTERNLSVENVPDGFLTKAIKNRLAKGAPNQHLKYKQLVNNGAIYNFDRESMTGYAYRCNRHHATGCNARIRLDFAGRIVCRKRDNHNHPIVESRSTLTTTEEARSELPADKNENETIMQENVADVAADALRIEEETTDDETRTKPTKSTGD